LYAIGYYYEKVIVEDAMLNTKTPEPLLYGNRLLRYRKPGFSVLVPIEDFKQRFINLDRQATQTEMLAEDLAEASAIWPGGLSECKANQMLNGITFRRSLY
jgi:hypothetical protein